MHPSSRSLLVGALAAIGLAVPIGPAAADHVPESPDDPYPPHTVHDMAVEVLAVEVDATGLLNVRGTVVCDRPGSLEVNVYLEQVKGQHRAYASDMLLQDACPTTPTDWTLALRSLTDVNFVPGAASLSYVGDEFIVDEAGISLAHTEGSVAPQLRQGRDLIEEEPSVVENGMALDVTEVTVDPGGSLTVHGTIVCDEATDVAGLHVGARQDTRRFSAFAQGDVEPLACGPTTSAWTMRLATPVHGDFHPGDVTLAYHGWSPQGGAGGHEVVRATR